MFCCLFCENTAGYHFPLDLIFSFTMAAVCHIEGNSDMYGLGIRICYYLQWYSGIFASWIAPSEVPNLRNARMFFSAATFLATIISVARSNLEIVEVYIVFLLTAGASLHLLVLFIWRMGTGFKP